MASQSSTIVIGAGLAGLTAAHRLQQEGVRVTVLERSSAAGGRVQTERHGRYLIDTGPDALTSSYRRYLNLVRELGLGDRVVSPSQVVGFVHSGRIVDVDPAKPWRLGLSPILSTRGKVRVARGIVGLRRVLGVVDAYDLAASADLDAPETTAYDYALPRFGREATDRLIDPVIRLVTGSGSRNSSLLGLLGALRSWSAPLLNLTGGLDSVPAALAERVGVRCRHTVTGVADTGTGVTVSYTDGAGGTDSLHADGCVIATMYPVAGQLWPQLGHYSPEFAANLHEVKLITVSLGYRAPTRSQAYAVLVPTVEQPDVLLIFLQHHKAPDRAPRGHSLVTLYTDSLATGRYLDRSDEELEAWAAGVVESTFPELRGHRELCVVTRWPHAGYHARPGYWRDARALRQALPATSPIQLAGDLFGAGSMESAVAAGEWASRRLTEGALASATGPARGTVLSTTAISS
jgi:oxygen-dependent protoporphyrinogen oxidase